MDSAASPTIGELFRTLSEMGFSEQQIQAAVQAGHFSVPAAAEWLLQEQNVRHRLVKQPSQPAETAFAAFNPPKESHAGSSDNRACPSLALNLPEQQPSTTASTEPPPPPPPPVESRIKQDKSDFQEQQRHRVAQEAKAERRQKKQERELVLKRIAEDRKSLQRKTQTSATAESATSPSSDQGQRLGGKIQTNVDNNCILMIRLPSGESMRERFPADAPLRSVVEHIAGRHPSLRSFALLQGFPRKRFGEAELACSLLSLGLTPSAALCIQTTPPETPQDHPPPPPSPPAVAAMVARQLPAEREDRTPCAAVPPSPTPPPPQVPVQDEAGMGDVVHGGPPPPLPQHLWEEAVGFAGIPGVVPPLSVSGRSHFWGRGQKLAPADAGEAASEDDEEEEEEEGGDVADLNEEEGLEAEGEPPHMLEGMPRLPFYPDNRARAGFEPRHHWPQQGNRLRGEAAPPVEAPAERDNAGGRAAAGLAAVERLQRAAEHQEDPQNAQGHPSPPKRPFRTPSIPSLCVLSTRATVQLMTAPSMQYISSLSCLTPELADILLTHMSGERLLRPRTLELFFGCPLQKFILNCYPYSTNELLRQLRAFTALKHLSLVNSPLITDSGLSVLSSLVKLQYLNLASCCKLTDLCLQHITGLKSLCHLSLDHTKVSDAGMVVYLQSAPSCLTQLSLNQTAVTEATLSALSRYTPQLRLLSIKQTKVSDVSALAELPCLQTLNLDGTGVTEGSLELLADHPTLSALSLAGVPVADGNHALQIISGLRLTHLTLPGRHSVTDAGLSFLCRLSQLSELDLTDYTQVTDQGVSLLSSMTRLVRLSLSNTQVTDGGLPALCSLQEMQDLCLDRTAVTSRGVAALITRLPHLQVLGLASTHVGDTVVRRGLIHCPQLLKLNLSRTRITDHGLKFLKHMYLAQVNLDGSGVTLSGIASLLSNTNISSIRASHTRSIPHDDVSDDDGEGGAP